MLKPPKSRDNTFRPYKQEKHGNIFMPRFEIENTKARHPAMSRLSNIFVIHSKLLISTTLHEHGTETPSAYSDKYWEHPLFFVASNHILQFFLQGIVLQNEMERLRT